MRPALVPDLRYHLCRLSKIGTPPSIRFCQKVFYQPHANIVAHLVQLFVDFHIVAVVVRTQLRNDGAVGERHELGVDFVNPSPEIMHLSMMGSKDFALLKSMNVLPDPERN
jgi:hypothetical protein